MTKISMNLDNLSSYLLDNTLASSFHPLPVSSRAKSAAADAVEGSEV
jgi:hypothetical protein